MEAWLNHPAIQSGIAPFLAALVVAELLVRLRLSGLCVIAGLAATVYLVADFNFTSLSSSKKIILATLLGAGIAPLLDLLTTWQPGLQKPLRTLIAALCGGVALWVFWPVLKQQEMQASLTHGAAAFTFIAWLYYWMDSLSATSVRAGAAGFSLGIASGLSALLGASALLGQLGLAAGSACGAYLLIQLLSGKALPGGKTFILPVVLLCGLIAPAAWLLAKMPWECLLLLAMIPLAARLPIAQNAPLRVQVVTQSVLALLPGAGAVAWAWHIGGSPV